MQRRPISDSLKKVLKKAKEKGLGDAKLIDKQIEEGTELVPIKRAEIEWKPYESLKISNDGEVVDESGQKIEVKRGWFSYKNKNY